MISFTVVVDGGLTEFLRSATAVTGTEIEPSKKSLIGKKWILQNPEPRERYSEPLGLVTEIQLVDSGARK